MRRTSTVKTTNRRKTRTIRLAASALAVTASLAGTAAFADYKGHGHSHHNKGHDTHYQGKHRHGGAYWNQQRNVRVHLPVTNHGPQTLPLGRMIMRNSNVDLDRYRLVAVETNNSRFSRGYASLHTGDSTSRRYFLGSWQQTRIPAPSHAERRWRLHLGPGSQVRSVTAILEPRHRFTYRNPAHRQHGSVYQRDQHGVQGTSWLSLAWMLAKSDDDDRHRGHKQTKRLQNLRAEQTRTRVELAKTRQQLERSQERNKQLKDQRSRLAEELAHERTESRPGKRGKKSPEGKRKNEREVKRTVRYVVSAS